MATWVCLLRAVNLGKHRKLPMRELREALTAAGLTNVRTYLQSGNVIVESTLETADQVSLQVQDVIAAKFSLDVPVITRRPAQLDRVIGDNPFTAQAAERPHLVRVIFLDADPAQANVEALRADAALSGTCQVTGAHVYVDYVQGLQATTRALRFVVRTLAVSGTERNWRTVLALAELCSPVPD